MSCPKTFGPPIALGEISQVMFGVRMSQALKHTGNLRLPSDPKRALGDIQAVQRDELLERELRS